MDKVVVVGGGGGGGGGGVGVFFFFKQKTAYEMCGRDWSSDVCSSDLRDRPAAHRGGPGLVRGEWRTGAVSRVASFAGSGPETLRISGFSAHRTPRRVGLRALRRLHGMGLARRLIQPYHKKFKKRLTLRGEALYCAARSGTSRPELPIKAPKGSDHTASGAGSKSLKSDANAVDQPCFTGIIDGLSRHTCADHQMDGWRCVGRSLKSKSDNLCGCSRW